MLGPNQECSDNRRVQMINNDDRKHKLSRKYKENNYQTFRSKTP